MPPKPFAKTDRRTACVRGILLAATFLGLIASSPVWTNARTFPLLPLFDGFPILPPPWDQFLYLLMLGSIVTAIWWYRPGVVGFLAASLLAYCGDQNRGQPWLYMYWVMLLLSLAPAPTGNAALRGAVAVVYLWGGIQKLNARFFQVTPHWFVAPASEWGLPQPVLDLFKLAVQAAPFVEIAIAVMLWFHKSRLVAFLLVILTHAFALLFLGPLGHNYNWVVWPWNLAMIGLVLLLFAKSRLLDNNAPATQPAIKTNPHRDIKATSIPKLADRFGWRQTLRELQRCRPALVLLCLYGLLPLLSYRGWWDSYFSFSLYSENLAVANIFCTESFRERLPEPLQKYARPFPQAYDPARQGPLTFSFTTWAYEEMHVPAISEPRNFVNVYQFLLPHADQPGELRMIIGPRYGPVIFREGDRVELLQRAR